MEWFVKAFLKSSLAWLSLGVTLGVAMAARPAWAVYRPAHVHMVLLGFVSMMIFGVAYHVLPRFTGNALHSRALAGAHWYAGNLGLLLMAAGFALRAHAGARATPLLASGGLLSALGAYAFAYVIWRTIDGPRGVRQAAARAAARAAAPGAARLPVLPDAGRVAPAAKR